MKIPVATNSAVSYQQGYRDGVKACIEAIENRKDEEISIPFTASFVGREEGYMQAIAACRRLLDREKKSDALPSGEMANLDFF